MNQPRRGPIVSGLSIYDQSLVVGRFLHGEDAITRRNGRVPVFGFTVRPARLLAKAAFLFGEWRRT